MTRLFLAALAALSTLCCPGCQGGGPDILAIESGPVLAEPSGIYQGIPYAAPPTGPLRWRPPAPPAPWTEPRRFDAPGPACPQADPDGPSGEDCLTLNVWTPAPAPGGRLPVLVFLHGGAFKAGASAWEVHDGAALAREGLVVITFNYRLGALGWLAHPLLSAESPEGVSGNYGLQDQLAALGWVRRNIAAFGGDPGNVTVSGQSAGAESVALLLTCPRAAGLFDRAVLQSPVLPGSLRPLRAVPDVSTSAPASAEDVGLSLARALGADRAADPLAALRAASPEALVRVAESLEPGLGLDVAGIVLGPTVDGLLLPEHPLAMFRAGRFHRVPLLLGVTTHEGSVFAPGLGPDAPSPAGLEALAARWFGPDAAQALRLLEASRPDPWERLELALTDRWFVAFARFLAGAGTQYGAPVWFYRYARPLPEDAARILAEDSGAGALDPARLGVPHGAELFALSGFTPWWLGFDGEDEAQAQALRGCWARFAATGDPGGEGPLAWPRFDPARPRALELGAAIRAVDLPPDPLLELTERAWLTRTY